MSNKIAIGCLVQWYEINIIEDYISSLFKSTENYYKPVLIDFCLVIDQSLEKIDESQSIHKMWDKFRKLIGKYQDPDNRSIIVYGTVKYDRYTISEYRRDFNTKYSSKADVLVWGESDMIVPDQFFKYIDFLHESSKEQHPKYIATFATCKMWDNSWKRLEHPDFTDKPFIEGDTQNWWSLRYEMSLAEMNEINSKVKVPEEIQIEYIYPYKFNGCGLVISSEVIKSGINVPSAAFFVHEDTAFMNLLQRVFDPPVPQWHFKNILLVHNRKSPRKRSYILGEEGDKTDIGKLRKSHPWYEKANKMSQENVNNLFDPSFKFHDWKDVFEL